VCGWSKIITQFRVIFTIVWPGLNTKVKLQGTYPYVLDLELLLVVGQTQTLKIIFIHYDQ